MGLDQWLERGDGDTKEEVAYWRKANHIHAWFVDYCNGGQEINLEPVPVNMEQLAGLKVTCERVLADPSLADKLLPTRGGFFFGGTDYDDYYLATLEETVKLIDAALLASQQGDTRPITYIAWW